MGSCASNENCNTASRRNDLACCTEADICTNSTLIANSDLWPNSVSGNCTDFPSSFATDVACCVPIPETTAPAATTAAPTSGALQTTLSAVAALLLSYIL